MRYTSRWSLKILVRRFLGSGIPNNALNRDNAYCKAEQSFTENREKT
jgi:hypothetical protein